MIKTSKSEHPTIMFELSEDETGVVSTLTFDMNTDKLCGACSCKRGKDHKCDSTYAVNAVPIGDDENSYSRMQTAVKEFAIGSYARVIMVNPLHCPLPSLPVYVNCTCNCFGTEDVREDWNVSFEQSERNITPRSNFNLTSVHFLLKVTEALCKKHLPKNMHFVGHGSDGDSRRFKAQREDMLRNKADKKNGYSPCKVPCMTLAGRREPGQKVPTDLHSQDVIHLGKKLISAQDTASKTLLIGDYHIEHTTLRVALHESGAGLSGAGIRLIDVERDDRQNFATVSHVGTFVVSHFCLFCSLLKK